jgi:PAS domain S-box-containing protein
MSGSDTQPDGNADGPALREDRPFRETDSFETPVEHGSDAIVSIDTDSTIVFANRSVERVFGREPTALIGEPLTAVMPERFHGAHHDAVGRYLATGERQLDWNDVRLPGQHADGHEIRLSITFEGHTVDGRRLFSGIMRDVTGRVERERELERQNEQLERFAATVSHDLRNPLQGAKAGLTVARAEVGDHEALDDIETDLDRMGALVDGVLELARRGRTVGDCEPVDLDGVAREAWDTVGGEPGSLRIEDPPTVGGDPERLHALFENLFRNSLEHAGPDATAYVAATADGFAVGDDGPGFADADVDRLFEHAYTTAADGTGFGLSVVREIAQAHGWTVDARERDGARFEFGLADG